MLETTKCHNNIHSAASQNKTMTWKRKGWQGGSTHVTCCFPSNPKEESKLGHKTSRVSMLIYISLCASRFSVFVNSILWNQTYSISLVFFFLLLSTVVHGSLLWELFKFMRPRYYGGNIDQMCFMQAKLDSYTYCKHNSS